MLYSWVLCAVVTSQKIILFTVTAVVTYNPTYIYNSRCQYARNRTPGKERRYEEKRQREREENHHETKYEK
jgi:hypothetical protein